MRHAFYLAFGIAAFAADPASAEVKTFRDWLAACDNVRSCNAYALRDSGGGAWLIVERDGAPGAAARFTILVDAARDDRFTLAFDDASLGGLPNDTFTAPTNDDLTKIEIADAETFLASLRKAATITAVRVDPKTSDDKIIGEISLSGAIASLLWIDEQQRRLGTVTALIRRGEKPASAVPVPPTLPTVTAAKPGAAPISKTFPPAILAKGRGICGPDDPNPQPGEVNALSGDLLLYWFECRQMSGAYNHWSGIMIAPRGNPQAARKIELPYPRGEFAMDGMRNDLIVNANFDDKGLAITMFGKGRGPGDCGSSAEWVFDGKAFRLTRYQSMPKCGGLISEYWPTIYRAEVK